MPIWICACWLTEGCIPNPDVKATLPTLWAFGSMLSKHVITQLTSNRCKGAQGCSAGSWEGIWSSSGQQKFPSMGTGCVSSSSEPMELGWLDLISPRAWVISCWRVSTRKILTFWSSRRRVDWDAASLPLCKEVLFFLNFFLLVGG